MVRRLSWVALAPPQANWVFNPSAIGRKLDQFGLYLYYDDRRNACAVVRSQGAPVRTGRRVRQQHERITLTPNGEPEAVLLSVEDLEGLEMTLEIPPALTLSRASRSAYRRWAVVSLALTCPPSARIWHGAAPPGRVDRTCGTVRDPFPVCRAARDSPAAAETGAAAMLKSCDAALAVNPQRVGKPLFGLLAGCHPARRRSAE